MRRSSRATAGLAALGLVASGCFGGSSSGSPESLQKLLADNNVPAHGRSLRFTVNHRGLHAADFAERGVTTQPITLTKSLRAPRDIEVCTGGRGGHTAADSLQCSPTAGPAVMRCSVPRTASCRYTIPAGVRVYSLKPQPDAPRTFGPTAHPLRITPTTTVMYLADPSIRLLIEFGGAGVGYAVDDRAIH
jgi:hypothetical protein